MRDPLSIIHFFPRIRLVEGGVVQTVLDLCRTLAHKGHHVTLATSNVLDVPLVWRQGQVDYPQVQELSKSPFVGSLLSGDAMNQFRGMLKGTDVVHLHTPWELSNLQLSRLLHREKIPYVVTVHGMLDDYSMCQKGMKKRAYLALGGRQLFSRATTVHFTAEAEREQAQPWIPGDYLSVIQACAMDLAPYENLPGPSPALTAFPAIDSSKQKILFLSRVHPKKGIDLLLHAAQLLKTRGLTFELLIAGPGEEAYVAELRQLAEKLEVGDSTHFLGMVRGDVKLSLYEVADVFVLPTHQENFGLVLPEALACKTPVVTTRGTDIWRELEQAGASIVDNRPDALADAIAELLRDESRRKSLGEQGRAYVQKWLGEDQVLAGYEAMYHQTIQRAGRN